MLAVQLKDLVGQAGLRACNLHIGHQAVDGQRSDTAWWHAELSLPGAELLGGASVDDAAESDHAVRGGTHRAVFTGRVDGRFRPLRWCQELGGPAGDRELRMPGGIAG